ncbi:MAG: hypothetical protein E7107_02560 [Prevotella sp.]|jgi:hypothetical protein|nr:hypothetical protein [Prevotella sp.]
MKKNLRYFFVAALAMMSMSTMAQTTVTFDAATDKGTRTSSDAGEDQITKDGVTIAVSNGCMNLTDQYRCYKGATFTVTSTAGNIAKVEISCTAEGTEKYGPGNFTDATAGAYTYEGKVGTWTGDAASFSMTSSTNQVRMNTVVVTLAGGGAEGGTRVWDFTILPTQKVDGTGNLEGNLGDAGVFVEDGGAAWQQVYNKAGLPDGTEFTCADGVVFEPTKGLKWSALENNKMVFYRNYPAAEGSNYGGKHLAFNKAAEVMIPAKAGQVIEMVLASSKSGGTTKKITSQDVVETFDDGGGIKIEFPNAYEYGTYTLTAKVDNPYLAFESTFCVQKITVKDAGSSEGGVIFSANPTEAWDAPAGAETEIPAANATIAGGKMYANNGQDAAKAMIKVQGGEAAFQCTNNNTFFKVVLDKALEAGDVISTRMQSRTDTDLGLFFGAEETRPNETTTSIILLTAAEQAWVDAPTYTVVTGDAICGQSTFYIFRATGKSTYFNTFAITRGGATGISDVKVVRVADGAIYNLAGQKVGKDYKGIVIMNGKKFMQK